MIISEDRCCAALTVEENGRPETELFDDIGCLLDRERTATGLRVTARYFRDYDTRSWIQASGGPWFIFNEEVHTPMGSGIVAFGERERAAARADAGRLFSREEVAAERQAWMEERYGKPAGK